METGINIESTINSVTTTTFESTTTFCTTSNFCTTTGLSPEDVDILDGLIKAGFIVGAAVLLCLIIS